VNHARTAVAVLAALALLAGAGTAAAAPGSGNGNVPGDAGPDAAGPPTDLPGPVPEFVGEIHRTIGEFLSVSVDSLGTAVSDLPPGGEESAESTPGDGGAWSWAGADGPDANDPRFPPAGR
jgi:hypothetical protein